MSGFYGISNFCDYICYDSKRLYLLDCKSHKGASFPFDAFSQYEKLRHLYKTKNLVTGIILWLYEKDLVYFVPTYTIEKMKQDGMKSINPKTIDINKYYIVKIPSVKLRTFMNSDYSVLQNVPSDYDVKLEYK